LQRLGAGDLAGGVKFLQKALDLSAAPGSGVEKKDLAQTAFILGCIQSVQLEDFEAAAESLKLYFFLSKKFKN